jgi:GDP-L-fucose synthase
MKILITGGNGYIAKSIYYYLQNKYDITTISRKDIDLTDCELVANWFKNKEFDIVIHCAIEGGNRLQQDTYEITDANLKMYYNLLKHRSHYKKFIHLGSGAELYDKDSPYGLSKHVIRKSILEKNEFYNLRIFAVFDENESDTRFIKANIKRYINKEPIEIYEDKYMDFIYMQDLIKIIEIYIENNKLQKETDCVYNTTYSLTKISQIINDLDNYKVQVQIKNSIGINYVGQGNSLIIDFIGLKEGIKNVYRKLKNSK